MSATINCPLFAEIIFLLVVVFGRPTTNAIMGLTFANYVLQPFFEGDCTVPVEAAQLLAGATICKFNNPSNK